MDLGRWTINLSMLMVITVINSPKRMGTINPPTHAFNAHNTNAAAIRFRGLMTISRFLVGADRTAYGVSSAFECVGR